MIISYMLFSYTRSCLINFINHVLLFLLFTSLIQHKEHILNTDQIPEDALRDQQNPILKTRALMLRIIKILRILINGNKFIGANGHKHPKTRQ